MVNIIFNYDGDIQAVKEQFQEQIANLEFTPISEMVAGSYMCIMNNADDFDAMDLFMQANGKIEVVSGFGLDGKQYLAKIEKNKYTKTKYLKYLLDKWTYDAEGNPLVKLVKDTWQVNQYMGWKEREL